LGGKGEGLEKEKSHFKAQSECRIKVGQSIELLGQERWKSQATERR